jgi:hypothetical protein
MLPTTGSTDKSTNVNSLDNSNVLLLQEAPPLAAAATTTPAGTATGPKPITLLPVRVGHKSPTKPDHEMD